MDDPRRSVNDLTSAELRDLWIGSISDLARYSRDGFKWKEIDEKTYNFCIDCVRIYSEASFVSVGFPGKPATSKIIPVVYGDIVSDEIIETERGEIQKTFSLGLAFANDEIETYCDKLIKRSSFTSEKLTPGDIFVQMVAERLKRMHAIGDIGEFDNVVIKKIGPNEYPSLGLIASEMWGLDAPFFKFPKSTIQTYRFRGLKMSFSHTRLAEELQQQGFMFACESHVFPPERNDESFIQPDIIVYSNAKALIVEVDGEVHWGGKTSTSNGRLEQFRKDRAKDSHWIKRGFATIRFDANKARETPGECVREISDYFESLK